jgi:SSS family solute:Na+ symporter
MIGKFYSIKNEDAIKKGTIISTVFAIIVAGGCYFLGGFGRLFDSPVLYSESGKLLTDKIVPSMLSNLPDVIIAIVIVLVLSASMSTLSSLVLTSSSTLTLDVIVPAMSKNGKEISEKKKLLILRAFIVFFIVISAVLAILKDTFNFTFIAQMMGVSWGALAGAFLAPFLYGLYSKRTTRAAVAVSFIWGAGIELVQLVLMVTGKSLTGVLGFIFHNSLYSGAFAMVSGLILVPLVSLVTKKPDKARVDEIFTCYDKTITTEVKKHLGE